MDLLRAALERGGPVTAPDIEARIASLTARGLLKGDREGRLLTTEGAIALERGVLAEKAIDDAKVAPVVVNKVEVRVRTQAAARELGLRRLSRQEAAAALLLSSPDRVVAVQGVAGAGKSAVLAPVTAVVRKESGAVIGLAIANTVARDLTQKTSANAMTVVGFTASRTQLSRAQMIVGPSVHAVARAWAAAFLDPPLVVRGAIASPIAFRPYNRVFSSSGAPRQVVSISSYEPAFRIEPLVLVDTLVHVRRGSRPPAR